MFIYHLIQPGFIGRTIYPLSHLEKTHPEVFARHTKKYADRPDLQELRNRRLPIVDCTMDDLVCFVSVDFSRLLQAFSEVHGIPEGFERRYFRVDTDQLDPENLLISFHQDHVVDELGKKIPTVDGYLSFLEAANLLPTEPPEEQIEAYRRDYLNGVKGPLAPYVPHVYYKGIVAESAITEEVFVWDPTPRRGL